MNYIELWKDDPALALKFRVVQIAYSIDAAIRMERTVGKVAFSYGAPIEMQQISIRTRAEEDKPGYGTREDLRQFYGGGFRWYKDNDGKVHKVHLLGKLAERPLTTVIAGNTAWFFDTIFLVILETQA